MRRFLDGCIAVIALLALLALVVHVLLLFTAGTDEGPSNGLRPDPDDVLFPR